VTLARFFFPEPMEVIGALLLRGTLIRGEHSTIRQVPRNNARQKPSVMT
jgi:hypothetical protein